MEVNFEYVEQKINERVFIDVFNLEEDYTPLCLVLVGIFDQNLSQPANR
jgi:hypothetical protein